MEKYQQDIKAIYLASWRFMLVCPLLFFIPVLVEFAQHVIEIQIGMYASADAFKALQHDETRKLFGFIKVLSTVLPGYWLVRYLGFNNSKQAATTIEMPAFGLWLVVVAFGLPVQFLSIFSGDIAIFFGLDESSFSQGVGIFTVGFSLLGIYLIGWSVAWTLGNVSIGWVTSIKLMHGHFIRAIVYMLAAVALYMVIHYGLGYLAMGMPMWLVWSLLTVDSLLVGLLVLNMTGAGYFAVSRAAAEKGVELVKVNP